MECGSPLPLWRGERRDRERRDCKRGGGRWRGKDVVRCRKRQGAAAVQRSGVRQPSAALAWRAEGSGAQGLQTGEREVEVEGRRSVWKAAGGCRSPKVWSAAILEDPFELHGFGIVERTRLDRVRDPR
jgi:hypothetical protein